MVQVSTAAFANSLVDMSNPNFVDFGSLIRATSGEFSWNTPSVGGVVEITGSGFTYSGSGADTKLLGGTISRIRIAAGGNGGDLDITVTGTDTLNGASIDKDDPRSFWNEVLKGNDTFDLSGLDKDSFAGPGFNTIFGDDLASATSSFIGVTDRGGDDTITGGDNGFDLIGDVYRVVGSLGSPGTFDRWAEYDAGNDTIVSAVTIEPVDMYGDAKFVGSLAVLHGGDDTLDSRNNSFLGTPVGDVYSLDGGTVFGGNDTIQTASNIGSGATAIGDVENFLSGTLHAGEDEIVSNGRALSYIAGDIGSIADTDNSSSTITFGDDRITGGDARDVISGDVLENFSGLITVVAGNDTISGGGGNDALYGEVWDGFLTNVSGGNDRMFGGPGNDNLHGQTGNDLLNGGSGNDTVNGGTGRDTADYSLVASRVVVNLATQTASGTGIGSDTLVQIENASGGSGADALTGSAGANKLKGNAGFDELTGGRAIDVITGGQGTRDDFNYLTRFDSTGPGDLITDFEVGRDNIDVSALSTQVFTFSGKRATFNTATAPELRYVKDTANDVTHVYGDVNGDNETDLHIRETGLLNMTKEDFIL